MPRLVEIRNQLRRENLHDTEEPPLEKKAIPPNLDPALREERTVDGTYNDLEYPAMGSCGRRFGRNVPLEHTFPGHRQPDDAQSARRQPRADDPRRVSAGHDSQSAGRRLDSVHGARLVRAQAQSTTEDGVEIPLAPGDDWSDAAMKVPRIGAGAGAGRVDAAAGLRQPEQPLVGRLADLRLRSGRRARSCEPARAAS